MSRLGWTGSDQRPRCTFNSAVKLCCRPGISHLHLQIPSFVRIAPFSRMDAKLVQSFQRFRPGLMRILRIVVQPPEGGNHYPLMHPGSGIRHVVVTEDEEQRDRSSIQEVLQASDERPTLRQARRGGCGSIPKGSSEGLIWRYLRGYRSCNRAVA